MEVWRYGCLDVGRSGGRGGLEVMQAWSRRGLEAWRLLGYGGEVWRSGRCAGMEGWRSEGRRRYGGEVWRSGGRVGMEVEGSGGGRRGWRRSEGLEVGRCVWRWSKAPEAV